MPVSKNEINRCGERLGLWWSGEEQIPADELHRLVNIVWAFRSTFQYPMTKTAVGLRQFVQRESSQVIVAQRLKRLPTIIEKMVRLPGTKLARMEDVGGCRAVLPGGRSEIEGVLRRIRRNWTVVRLRDYMEEPKSSGYRGVHLIVERDDRRIEVQLRTTGQQAWAEQVERLAGRYRVPLKDEKGPDELLRWLRLAAEGISMEDVGQEPTPEFEEEFTAARVAAWHWMGEHDV